MDDFSDLISTFLDNPDNAKMIKSFLNDAKTSEKEPSKENHQGDFDIDPVMLSKVARVMTKYKSDSDDDRTRLLCAISPFLSEHRRQNIQKVKSILKIITIFDAFSDDFKF